MTKWLSVCLLPVTRVTNARSFPCSKTDDDVGRLPGVGGLKAENHEKSGLGPLEWMFIEMKTHKRASHDISHVAVSTPNHPFLKTPLSLRVASVDVLFQTDLKNR